MSNFAGHLAGGAITSAACAYGIYHFSHDPKLTGLSAAMCLGFSLFPDVDVKSVPSRIFYWVLIAFLGWLYWKGMYREGLIAGIGGLLPQLVVHRGFFHSLVASILIPAFVFMGHRMMGNGCLLLWACGVIGYSTHRFLDGMLFRL